MASAILQQLDRFGPQRCERTTYDEAAEYTRQLARTHYENFTVVSWMLPRALRDDFRHVYAFCRSADDLGDETGDPAKSLELLEWWQREIAACYANEPRHPVFVALHHTIRKHDIPRKPFDDLVDAFIQDQRVTRYDTWPQVLDYCTRSADPVGRLVLYLCGYRDQERQRLSDATCTALQLTNFWQDVRRDILERDRVYLPRDVAQANGLDVETLVKVVRADEFATEAACCGCNEGIVGKQHSVGVRAILPAYQAAVKEAVERTWPLFAKGRALWPHVAGPVRSDVELFTRGGEAILRLIERRNYDTLSTRPKLSKGAKIGLMMGAMWRRMLPGRSAGKVAAVS